MTKQLFETVSLNVGLVQNFKNYFHKDNANNLIQKSVTKNRIKEGYKYKNSMNLKFHNMRLFDRDYLIIFIKD